MVLRMHHTTTLCHGLYYTQRESHDVTSLSRWRLYLRIRFYDRVEEM